jgi:hypothetical protein
MEVKMDEEQWIPVEVPSLPWTVGVRLAVVDGRSRLVGLHIEPDPRADPAEAVIGADHLRNFPLRQVLRSAVDAVAVTQAQDWTDIRPGPGTPIPEEHYRMVATARDDALQSGRSAAAYIQSLWDVSRATANAWLREAKKYPVTTVTVKKPAQRSTRATRKASDG